MDPGEQTTGTRDEQYNLVSVLYHALHGAETVEAYILDAEAAGDERLAAFFWEAQATHRQLAEQAKGLLGIGGGVTPGVGEVSGGVPTGDVPPRTAESGWEIPPPPPRRETPPAGTAPPGGDVTPEGAVPPVTPGMEETPSEPPPPTDVAPDTPREAPPPGEERPERRGAAPTTPTPREEPPPGEERPERRTP